MTIFVKMTICHILTRNCECSWNFLLFCSYFVNLSLFTYENGLWGYPKYHCSVDEENFRRVEVSLNNFWENISSHHFFRFSGTDGRLNLVFYFRCFYDVIKKDLCLKSQLIIDAKDYIVENKQNKAMSNFCQALLWDHQDLHIERPIMHIVMRGTPLNREMLIQLRYEKKIIQYFWRVIISFAPKYYFALF